VTKSSSLSSCSSSPYHASTFAIIMSTAISSSSFSFFSSSTSVNSDNHHCYTSMSPLHFHFTTEASSSLSLRHRCSHYCACAPPLALTSYSSTFSFSSPFFSSPYSHPSPHNIKKEKTIRLCRKFVD